MVYDETNTFKDAKQLDVQEITIYRTQYLLKGAGNFKDRQRIGSHRKMWAHKSVIAIKRPESGLPFV